MRCAVQKKIPKNISFYLLNHLALIPDSKKADLQYETY